MKPILFKTVHNILFILSFMGYIEIFIQISKNIDLMVITV